MSHRTTVIGGTGFIGSRLVLRLAGGGDEVVVISRGGRWPWGALPSRVTVLACDIADPAQGVRLGEVLSGARRVVNVSGALFRPTTPRNAYARVHVEGTRRVIDALASTARAEAPVRLVHVSSTGVLGPTGASARDEAAHPAPGTVYERTKLEGERVALAGRRRGLEVVVVRPGLVYGPHDRHLLHWFRAIAARRFLLVAGGRAKWQPIHVDDLARGIESSLAATEIDGGVFHLAGTESSTVSALASRIADAVGVKRPCGSIPLAVAYAAGVVLETVAAPFSVDPPLSRSRVRTLTEDRVYAIDRAERVLGFRPAIPLDRGLAETVAWYRAQGLLS